MLSSAVKRVYWILTISCVFIGAGCARAPELPQPPVFQHTSEEVMAAINKAEKDVSVLKSLAAPQKYPQEFANAENALAQAKTFINTTPQEIDSAYASAQQSLAETQAILRKLYEEMAESREVIKRKIKEIAEEDPDSIDQQIIVQLDGLLADYDAEQEINAEQLVRDIEQLKQIEYNAKKNLGKTFESDVSFGAGEYELSDKGKEAIREYYQDVLTAKQQFRALFPNDSLKVTVKVIGYADQVGILSSTKLYKQLIEGAENLPGDADERKIFLNQRLSELRAKAIADYVKELILQDCSAEEQLVVEQIIEGAGEKLPPNIESPYPYQDPRRRICRIFCWLSTQE